MQLPWIRTNVELAEIELVTLGIDDLRNQRDVGQAG